MKPIMAILIGAGLALCVTTKSAPEQEKTEPTKTEKKKSTDKKKGQQGEKRKTEQPKAQKR